MFSASQAKTELRLFNERVKKDQEERAERIKNNSLFILNDEIFSSIEDRAKTGNDSILVSDIDFPGDPIDWNIISLELSKLGYKVDKLSDGLQIFWKE